MISKIASIEKTDNAPWQWQGQNLHDFWVKLEDGGEGTAASIVTRSTTVQSWRRSRIREAN